MANVIIVSNRLPVSVRKVNGELEYYPSVGGLATGLSAYVQDKRNKWIGWPGIASDELTEHERLAVAQELLKHNCYPVFLTKKQLDSYMNGYCNTILWPLFHNLPTRFGQHERFLKAYKAVNRLFAEAVLALSRPSSTIWIHDYHLLLLPALLRKDRPHDTIGLFLHIPFPAPSALSKLPSAKALLRGMLGVNLLGFHTPSYVNNLLDSCYQLNIGIPSAKEVIFEDRVVRVTDFPMGIDYNKFAAASNSKAGRHAAKELRKKYGRKKVILTVDRLDPTKGLVARLQAYGELLRTHPKLRRKVVLVMFAVPSRTEIDEYQKLRRRVEELVSQINQTFGSKRWQPVEYIYKSVPQHELTPLYKIADVAFITPIRDGMNLVAKEYVASKTRDGVLILSQTAGAAEELTNAIIVNPADQSSLVDGLAKALTMPRSELKRSLKLMQAHLSVHTVQHWATSFITSLQHSSLSVRQRTKKLGTSARQQIRRHYYQAGRRLLLLDYDGVLTPFLDDPAAAVPPKKTIQMLTRLSSDPGNRVAIISGRSRHDLQKWFGALPVILAAEHGAMIREPGKKWRQIDSITDVWKEPVKRIMARYAAKTPGAFVEEKERSVVWHFRRSPAYYAQKNATILKRILKTAVKKSGLGVFSGNKIIEVKPLATTKGRAIHAWLPETDFVLAIGDDYTDEDMFASLPPSAHTIKVGPGKTHAKYRLKGVRETLQFLQKLL